MSDQKTAHNDHSTNQTSDQQARDKRPANDEVWPSASTSSGGAYIPSRKMPAPDQAASAES